MAQILTPPASRHTSESPEIQQKEDELSQTLDTLLERYLALLDRHQKLQADLAKQLSSGFLSLAQANYTCPPGRRYGADYYDERMKATRRVSLRTSSHADADDHANDTGLDSSKHTFTVEPMNALSDEHAEKDPPDETLLDDGPTPDDSNVEETQTEDESALEEPASNVPTPPNLPKPRKKFRSLDPITWYGILVPPSLRSSQQYFTEAVANHVPELASVMAEMQTIEKEVDEVRSQLG